jgi:hypothetical protein
MASSKGSLTHIQARVTSAIAGVSKNLSAVTQISLAGVVFTPTTLLALLQAYVTLVTALSAAHNQVHGLVTQEKTQRKQMIAILQALNAFVINMFGTDPSKLGDFGFSPRKVGVESAATRAASVAKAKATRNAKKAALAAITSPVTPPAVTGSTTTKS